MGPHFTQVNGARVIEENISDLKKDDRAVNEDHSRAMQSEAKRSTQIMLPFLTLSESLRTF